MRRLRSLRQLIDDKSVASGQQTCCKYIAKVSYPQACLLQVVSTSCNKFANDKLQQLSLILTDLLQLDEVDKFAG